ncbi:MAG: hypothetical protein QM736_17020 [Vicinamibacterales bacterium]
MTAPVTMSAVRADARQTVNRYKPHTPRQAGQTSGQSPVLVSSHAGEVAAIAPAIDPAREPNVSLAIAWIASASNTPPITGSTNAAQSCTPVT